MDLSIIIVNYKSREKTLNCLKSVKEADWGGLSYEIIVVDNASGDDLSPIASAHPEVKIIRSEKNLGMGGGNNLGAKNSSGEFILVLNPDTIVGRDSVKKLYEYLKSHNEAGVVGPKLLNSDGTLQYSCLRFPKVYTPILRRTFFGGLAPKHLDEFLMKDYGHKETREVDWLIGSCLMLRREIFARDGFIFNEKYFMYFEDTDFCRRVREKHNLKAVYLPLAEVIHDHARQSADKPWYIAPFADRLARAHIKSWLRYFFRKK